MKNIILILCLGFLSIAATGQIKVVTNGNVGLDVPAPLDKLDVNGNVRVRGNKMLVGYQATGTAQLILGQGRSGDGTAEVSLLSDVSDYPIYGFRFFRTAIGQTAIQHRGTFPMQFNCVDAASVVFQTNSTNRMIVRPDGKVGIGTISPTHLLETAGDIKVNGVIRASDKRLKNNVKKFKYGLKEVLNLDPLSYFYNGKGGTSTERRHVGVYAQDLQQIAPDLVAESIYKEEDELGNVISEETFLEIDDTAIKYMIINAVKEQQEIIDNQEKQIRELQAQLERVIELVNTSLDTDVIDADLSGKNNFILEQNYPNPFKGQTSIKYEVPEDIEDAAISVFDMQGRLIKTIELSDSKKGTVNLSVSDLPAGDYKYSLVAEGKVIGTKSMVITN